jgi:hypothetical protein
MPFIYKIIRKTVCKVTSLLFICGQIKFIPHGNEDETFGNMLFYCLLYKGNIFRLTLTELLENKDDNFQITDLSLLRTILR